MFSPCPNPRTPLGRPAPVQRCFCAVSLALVVASTLSCRREERNFSTGGPDQPAKSESKFVVSKNAAPAEGPQNQAELNAFALSEGKRLYSAFNCVGCHANGGGDIGPALMDQRWFYGATPDDVYHSIMDGRPNGMPPFRERLTDAQARQLTAYVRSLSGQAGKNASPARDDHMRAGSPENSQRRVTPRLEPAPALTRQP